MMPTTGRMSATSSSTSNAEPGDRGFGLSDAQLRSEAGPALVDDAFVQFLEDTNAALAATLKQARRAPPTDALALSELLIEIASELDTFVSKLFAIGPDVQALARRHDEATPLLRVKYKFVKRQALLGIEPDERKSIDPAATRQWLGEQGADPDDEPVFAAKVLLAQQEARDKSDEARAGKARAFIERARLYAAWAAGTPAGRRRHASGVLFDHPQATDPGARIEHRRVIPIQSISAHTVHPDAQHQRRGFDLTDAGGDLNNAMDQAKYCLLCHRQGNDSCSHGLPAEQSRETLNGCPLDERISEFMALKLNGHAIGALAMIALDNPMLAATGHRICNECTRSCVFQQQTPVDIPKAETRVLRDVLALPWGFEIYALLTQWNPLNLQQWVPAPRTGKRVLVVGAGPAGFTLAHHLLNAGHTVVAIDGLKIEPGADPKPSIRDAGRLQEPLSERIASGFGGVAEYGITVRWDKNFLTLIRLLLERRERFRLLGGVRFGGTLSTREAWAHDFDHIALATGAGGPGILDINGGLAPGVRAASDFLMALQLTGAARRDSIANLQLALPAVVIGGGLTAMDTATEALAYYPVQVEKFLQRFEVLSARYGEAGARAHWPAAQRDTAQAFIAHARAIREEQELARAEQREPRINRLLDQWGGVTVVYRRHLTDSPAYRLNPEEVANALAEGVRIVDQLQPRQITRDEHGYASGVELTRTTLHGESVDAAAAAVVTLPARTVLIATGTRPNAMLAREEPELYQLDGESFAALNELGERVAPDSADNSAFFCRHEPDGRKVSFIGDAHPAYSGNVVRAMASARLAAPVINRSLADLPERARADDTSWLDALVAQYTARVHRVERLGDRIVQVTLHAPAAARAFRPGQFYRLQNFEQPAARYRPGDDAPPTRLGMEGLAMTGAWVDTARGLLATVVLEMGGSSDLCADLQTGDPVVLMGPTGTPTEIPSGERVVLVGGGLGNAVLFSIGAAMRASGCEVLYFAAYRDVSDRFGVTRIEAAANHVVWCIENPEMPEAVRPTDTSFHGNVVQALVAHNKGELANIPMALGDADRLITIGSDRMMAAVAKARQQALASAFRTDLVAIASVNSPMQCMMKEICGQCLQRQVDPRTGESRVVFTCVAQDQPLEMVDFDCLAGRLDQNSLAEAQTRQWLNLVRDSSQD